MSLPNPAFPSAIQRTFNDRSTDVQRQYRGAIPANATNPCLHWADGMESNERSTDVQRLFNDRSTDVQRAFNVCCLFPNGRWQVVQPTITHYPLPIDTYVDRVLGGGGHVECPD
jgi:hypothetical protein